MVLGYIAPGCAAEGRSTVYQNVGNYYTSDSYRQEMAYLKQQDSVRLYYFAASDYQDGDLDIWIDTIREYDTSGQTGEMGSRTGNCRRRRRISPQTCLLRKTVIGS